MYKKVFVFGIIFLFLLLTIVSLRAESSSDTGDAYTCLREKIKEKTCAKLTAEEKIFSILADSKCKTELKDDSKDGMCWPKILCKTKTTSQAILALENSGENTDKAISWLLAKKTPSNELIWYLQIISSQPTTCQITYDSQSYSFDIGEDKKIKSSAGTCLSISSDGYWFKVKSTCFEKEFSISCDERFSTSMIYQKKTSSTIYVSEKLNSASAEGTTTEKVNSYCFHPGDEKVCNYESTLWAALALKQAGKEIDSYLPYLISMADDNEKYIPESFLYKLTKNSGYYDDLINKQLSGGYWENSGDKFYDTAVALYSMQGEDTTEKTDAISWLLSVQDKNGCWKGISETAFLLYAVWQQSSPAKNVSDSSDLKSCSDLGGKICSYDEECSKEEVASNQGKCCLGKCEETSGSGSGTVIPSSGKSEKQDYTFVWVLAILIVLVVIGIIFKDKLRMYWFIAKSRFGKGDNSQGPSTPPGFLPPTTQEYPAKPRRILPHHPSSRHVLRREKPLDKEFSDVLNKLKEMGG